METKSEYILKFHDYDSAIFWRLNLTPREFELLHQEVNRYNDWINTLYLGLAPLSSYADPTEADQLYLAHKMIRTDNSYAGEFQRPGGRGYYEPHNKSFSIYSAEYRSDQLLNEDYDEESGEEDSTLKTIEEIITSPLSDEFGMGYRLLPMTARIIGKL